MWDFSWGAKRLPLAGELSAHELRNVANVPVVFRDLLTQIHCLNSPGPDRANTGL
jgi:hypothetical protein